jgi:hypothetical protein
MSSSSSLSRDAQERVNEVTLAFQRELQSKVRQFDLYAECHMAWLNEIAPETRNALRK